MRQRMRARPLSWMKTLMFDRMKSLPRRAGGAVTTPPVESDAASDQTEQNDAASAMAEVLAESEVDAAVDDETDTVQLVRPFASLEDLPDDLAEAFDAFKLAILRHKTAGWQGVPCEVVLKSLDALKELATAPAGECVPF